MTYIENPKTKGSGIICCIPHKTTCPINCEDCFFQSGRSYLEPLEDNIPNMPSLVEAQNKIVRVNDGNDSNNKQEMVMGSVSKYLNKFYNTSIGTNLEKFDAPVVLTVNPGKSTDNIKCVTLLKEIPTNLMFVRVRVNTWNLDLVDKVVEHYSEKEIPIVLTFMAYFVSDIPDSEARKLKTYVTRKRTTNTYCAITTDAWETIMNKYKDNKWVYSCGKIEGERGVTACRHCGNCLREYYACIEKMS